MAVLLKLVKLTKQSQPKEDAVRHTISLLIAIFLITANVPAMATSWMPWYAKKQNLTHEQFLVEIARDDKKILRVSSEEYARQLGNELGIAAPQGAQELADFLNPRQNPDITVGPCTDDLIRKVKMGRTNKDGIIFDFNFTRSECGKGEQFLFYKGRPIISLWCGNLIVAPKPVERPLVEKAVAPVKSECFVVHFRLTENGRPFDHTVRLTAKSWLRQIDQKARDVVYDPCFKQTSRECDNCPDQDVTYTSDIPERHQRKSDDLFEIPIKNGVGELSLPMWYVDPNGPYAAEFLFCSEDEDFEYPRTREGKGIRVLSEHISSVWNDGGNIKDPIVFSR